MVKKSKSQQGNPLQKINDFLRLIGFDDKKIAEHHQRLNKLIYISIADDLDKLSVLKNEEPFPLKLKSMDDFFKYYEKYLSKELIAKIVQEKYYKFYSGYIGAIDEKLKGVDSI